MRGSRFPALKLIGVLFAGALLASAWLLLGERGGARAGETWRRGVLSGEQMRMDGGRYTLQRWSLLGAGETLETGSYVKLGDVLSLVPGTPGRAPRLLRMEVQGDTWRLYEPDAAGRVPADGRVFERLD